MVGGASMALPSPIARERPFLSWCRAGGLPSPSPLGVPSQSRMPSADLTERLRGDDTTAPVLVKSKTDIGLCSAYLRMMIDRSAAAVRLLVS